jgi:hypothetical protein
MVAVPVGRSTGGIEDRALALISLALGLAAALAVLAVARSEGDPLVFLRIADPIALGDVAYRDLPVEYPPIALLPIVLPRILVGVTASPEMYTFAFGAIALTTTLVCGAVVAWLSSRGWSREDVLDSMLFFVAMAFALTVCIIWRFDVLPAAFTIMAVALVATGRPGWAGLALALGVMTKLYPGFLVPVFLAYYVFNGRWRSAAILLFGLLITLVGVMGFIYLFAGGDVFGFLTYQRDRGTEIESILGGLAMAGDAFLNIPATVHFAFGAFEVRSPLLRTLAAPDFIFQVGLVVVLGICGLRAMLLDRREFGLVRRETFIQYIVATILVVILANKVLSPQYLCWLLPFAVLLPAPQALLLVAASVLTTIEYPITFDALRAIDPFPVLIVNVRNAMLFALFVWVIVASQRRDVRETSNDPGGNAEYEYDYGHAAAP